MNTTTAPNQTEVSELRIFIDNDAEIYHRDILPIIKAMKKRLDAKTYDANKGIRYFNSVVEKGSKSYVAKFCSTGDKWHQIFSLAVRTQVANEMQDYFLTEIGYGNY